MCHRSLFGSKKAFDTVNHDILCDKLDHYGIRGHSLEFFKSYLTNRSQFTYCNNVSSSSREITYGVSQDSVLGPLLFLIYINGIVNCVEGANVRLFAADTTIFTNGKDLHKMYTDMQSTVCIKWKTGLCLIAWHSTYPKRHIAFIIHREGKSQECTIIQK